MMKRFEFLKKHPDFTTTEEIITTNTVRHIFNGETNDKNFKFYEAKIAVPKNNHALFYFNYFHYNTINFKENKDDREWINDYSQLPNWFKLLINTCEKSLFFLELKKNKNSKSYHINQKKFEWLENEKNFFDRYDWKWCGGEISDAYVFKNKKEYYIISIPRDPKYHFFIESNATSYPKWFLSIANESKEKEQKLYRMKRLFNN